MSSSINTVVIVGRLTRDPELRKTSSGTSYCRFTVACDRQKRKDSQEDPGADFISCVAWRQSADFITGYAEKGSQVTVEGSIETGSYTDREGRKVYTTEVLCDRIQIADTKKQRSDTPRGGRSVRMEDLTAETNEGFDTGPEVPDLGEDLPF